MQRYKFPNDAYELTNEGHKIIEHKTVIYYKCLICGYIHDWDDTWDAEKKEEVKIEVDKHHDNHIVSQS